MNEEQLLLAELNGLIAGAQNRCKVVSGMWIIEVVHANITPATKQQYVDGVNQALGNLQSARPVWKLFLYASLNERFVESGTLHTVQQTYSADGISTTTLAAGDCYLDITAFDAEAMQLGLEAGLVVLGRESRTDQGQLILGYQPNATYLWLEALGGNFGIAQNGTQQLQNGYIQITLGPR